MTKANDTQINFIHIELDAALMFCRFAQQADHLHLPRYFENARKAYDAAVYHMHRFKIEKVDFAFMIAEAKRLNVMLTDLAIQAEN